MYVVTVKFEILAESVQYFLPLMHANARASVENEPGCRQFDVCTDPARPGDVFLYEVYDNEQAFQAHLKTAHFQQFDAETSGMIASKDIATFGEILR